MVHLGWRPLASLWRTICPVKRPKASIYHILELSCSSTGGLNGIHCAWGDGKNMVTLMEGYDKFAMFSLFWALFEFFHLFCTYFVLLKLKLTDNQMYTF